ncbi:MAG: ANTAR domain-containing protein, partial [Clostridia bacterium]|nr:ANTAR domain-containing protein [Clostridia bacterium]
MTDLKEQTYSTLLLSSSPKTKEAMTSSLVSRRCVPLRYADNVAAARRELLLNPCDLVLIDTPLPDEFGIKLAIDLCETTTCGVLLLIKSDHYPEIQARISSYGVMVVPKPLPKYLFEQTLDMLCATRDRLRHLQEKSVPLEEKMEEIRLVNRAKWVLMEKKGLSEAEAHRTIEKSAMDHCVSKRVIAEKILEKFR